MSSFPKTQGFLGSVSVPSHFTRRGHISDPKVIKIHAAPLLQRIGEHGEVPAHVISHSPPAETAGSV
jgi:hypothetical protein